MISVLLNPFKFIAGIKSLIAGILIILATAFIGYLSHTNFPDLISVKICPAFPLWYFIIQSLANWLVFSLILYFGSIIFSASAVRFIDIIGTQALARAPYIIVSWIGFSNSFTLFSKYLLWKGLHIGNPVNLSIGNAITAFTLMTLSILTLLWMVTLMFNAFRVSSNLKGIKSIVLFIIVFIISLVLTYLFSVYLLTIYTTH